MDSHKALCWHPSSLIHISMISLRPQAENLHMQMSDDICVAIQAHSFEEIESSLTSDRVQMAEYYRMWDLKPNATKTSFKRLPSAYRQCKT